MTHAYYLENIAYRYADRVVIDIPRLTIEKKRINVLIGGNGAGKTTLLNLLAFLQKPDRGKLIFFDQETVFREYRTLRHCVGLVAQNPYLLDGSVLHNVALGLHFRGFRQEQCLEKARQALDGVGLGEFHGRIAKDLSGGEKQKIALARTIATEPQVLLLDEPFNHLDQNSIQQFENFLQQCVKERGMTVVLSTHEQLYGMAMADKLISLHGGRPVDAPQVNMYQGIVKERTFVTEKITIDLPADRVSGSHLIIDPAEIVLSQKILSSSMRNSFEGRVIRIAEEQGRVWVTVDAGEKFHVCITHESLQEMSLTLGSIVWVNFKSTSVKVF